MNDHGLFQCIKMLIKKDMLLNQAVNNITTHIDESMTSPIISMSFNDVSIQNPGHPISGTGSCAIGVHSQYQGIKEINFIMTRLDHLLLTQTHTAYSMALDCLAVATFKMNQTKTDNKEQHMIGHMNYQFRLIFKPGNKK